MDATETVTGISVDLRLLTKAVHDLRNPLNVIALTLRVIDQLPPRVKSELEEDLGFLKDNCQQMETMLTLLSDCCRLPETLALVDAIPFTTLRFLQDVVEIRGASRYASAFPAKLEIAQTAPETVVLDPNLAQQAFLCALTNAAGAADRPITVTSYGVGDRWIIGIKVDRPASSNVRSVTGDMLSFERLLGTQSERRGLDLALAASISARFGGVVRLDVDQESKTTIVLDWPCHYP